MAAAAAVCMSAELGLVVLKQHNWQRKEAAHLVLCHLKLLVEGVIWRHNRTWWRALVSAAAAAQGSTVTGAP